MSHTKNPILRYNIIDQCLSSKHKRYWSPEALMDKFADYDLQVELRTLKYDMQNMRENSQLNYNAPIAYCRINKGYYYTDDQYSIEGLSPGDLMALTFIVNLTEQFEGSGDLVQKARGTVSKLSKRSKSFKPGLKAKQNILSIEPRPFSKGIRYLGLLVEAVFNEQPLRIAYQKFVDDAPGEHVFHSYQLKMYAGRWYVRGYSAKHNDVIILALDRIEGIKEEVIPYRHDVAADDKEYFLHTIGISKGRGPVEDIQLEFTPEQGHYIKTLHLHHTQTILKDDDQSTIINLQLIQNYELCQLIMGYMPNVTVLRPTSLKEKIVDMLKNGLLKNASMR